MQPNRAASRAAAWLLLLAAVLVPSPSAADTASPEEELQLRAREIQIKVDAIKAKNVHAKARLLLFKAVLVGTSSLAKTPEEALAHAAEAPPEAPARLACSPDRKSGEGPIQLCSASRPRE
jgi:hypothetical protein